MSAATFLAERIGSSDGHSEALKEIVPFYLVKDDVDTAAELANSIDDPFARDRLLLDVAEKCAAIDDEEYALQLAEAIEDSGMQAITFQGIAFKKAERHQFKEALEFAEGLSHHDEVCAHTAIHQVASGNEQGALDTISKITFLPARIYALTGTSSEFQRKAQTDKAVEYLDKAHETTAEIEHDEERLRSLISIGEHYLQSSRNDKAIRTFAEAQIIAESLEGLHRNNLLSQISVGFLEAGSLELADRALDLVSNKSVIASTLAAYALHYHNKGEKDEAIEILNEAYEIIKSERDKEIVDSRGRFSIMGTIASRFAAFGQPEKGIDVALEIKADATRHLALSEIAQWCTLNDKDDIARQAVNSISENAEKVFVLISISDAKEQLAKNEEAIALLIEAHELCQPLPQLTVKSQALNHISTRLHRLGKAEDARTIAEENLLETVSRILDQSQKATTLAALSTIHKNLGFTLNDSEKSTLNTMLRKAAM